MLIVRMPRPELLELAETQGAEARFGPTTPGGWTVVSYPGGEEFDNAQFRNRGVAHVYVDHEYDEKTFEFSDLTLRVHDGTAEHRITWPEEEPPTGPVADAATSLAGLFDRPARAGALDAALRRPYGWDEDVVEALIETLDLPELADPAPSQAVAVLKGPPDLARVAARVAGPAAVDDGAGGWTTLLPIGPVTADDGSPAFSLAAGLSGGAKRKPVLLIWRDGAQCGLLLWRRGRIVETYVWNDVWRYVPDRHVDVDALIKRLRPADPDRVRALIARQPAGEDALTHPVPDPLPELIALLGLPPAVLIALDHPRTFRSNAPLVETTGTRQAIVEYAREGMFELPRVVRLGYAVLTGLAALVCALMTALMVTILATDGEYVDQAGTGASDWGWLAAFAALTVVLSWTAWWRWRAARRDEA